MGITFSLSGVTAGSVANATEITNAFNAINTYLTNGIPTTDLAKPQSIVSITMEFNDSIGAGSYEVRGFKVPSGVNLKHVETSIFRASPSGQMDVTLHDAYSEATGGTDAKVSNLQIASGSAAGSTDTSTDAYTFSAGTSVFVRTAATTAAVYNANVTMFFKTTHVVD